MDLLVQRVARRFLADAAEYLKRIEAIPGWDRSNFLHSIHDQARRGRALSEKQLAVLQKIEKDQGARAPAAKPAHADILLSPRKEWVDHSEYKNIAQALRKKSPVTVYDPRGLVAPNQKALAFVVSELANDFWGRAEQFAEYNADEEDPENRMVNDEIRHSAEHAAQEMEKARLQATQNGPITTLTLTPAYRHVLEKHGLGNR